MNALDFFPEFSVTGYGRDLRVGLFVPESKSFRARTRYADMALPGSGTVEAVVVPADGGAGEFSIQLRADGIAGPLVIGTLTRIGEQASDASSAEALADALTTIVQRAFYDALTGNIAPATPATTRVASPGRNVVATPARWRARLLSRKTGLAAVVLCAVGLIAYGVVQALRPPQDPIQQALASDNYKDLQERIRKQVAEAAAKGGGAYGGALQGQNIAIDTLKAMGLNPGKASTGCLVGVK